MTDHASDEEARLQLALQAIQQLRSRVDELERADAEPIAVVGLACRFPCAADAEAYWRLLVEGRSGIRSVPPGRWDLDAPFPDPSDPDRFACEHGGFLDDIDQFDPAFFGITPHEASRLDPQQRLLLEVGWEAIEVAATDPRSLAGTRTGVFVGISESEYLQVLQEAGIEAAELYDVTGTTTSVASGRLSYHLGLRGPSVAVNTACSSSLVAVHLAVASLRRGECDRALVAGVNAMITPDASIAFRRAGALAADGRCKPFDAAADGYGRGEGCGAVVLRRLSDALADGDPVRAVIRGSAVNQDGRTNGLTAPSGRAQQEVIEAALADAGLAPGDIGYVEAHGTGTRLGDPIELAALGAVFDDRGTPLLVGAAKSNVGHLEAAAGMAGLLKTVLVLENGEVPPNLHFREPSPDIAWSRLAIDVPTTVRTWPEGGGSAAGVSSFGFSGTNAHVVLEPWSAGETLTAPPDRRHQVLRLSARSGRALAELAGRFGAALAADSGPSLADMCTTAAVGRTTFNHRLAVVADTAEEAASQLDAFADGRPSRAAVGEVAGPRHVAFLFAGQGSQHLGMGCQLYGAHEVFRATIDRCSEALVGSSVLDHSLLDVLFAEPDSPEANLLDRTAYAQPALFAIECALATLWRSWGVEPTAVLGHSTGELAAACVAGAVELEDGVRFAAERAQLIESAPGGSTVAALDGEDAVLEGLGALRGSVAVAAVNGPRETVVAGPTAAVDEAVVRLKEAGIDSRRLNLPHAPHCELVDGILDGVEAAAGRITWQAPTTALVANVTGETLDHLDAAYWRRQVRQPVRFADGIRTVASLGCDVLLEVGSQPVLQLLGRQSWPGSPARWVASLWPPHDELRQVLTAAAELHVVGVELDWRAGADPAGGRRTVLPTSPFERSRHWVATTAQEEVPIVTRPVIGPRDVAAVADDVRRLVADLLEVDASAIGHGSTFIELGADSLLLARLAQELEDHFGVLVGIGELFDELDTVEALAAEVERQDPGDRFDGPSPSIVVAPVDAGVVGGVGPESVDVVAGVVAEQLSIMSRQLELLGGAPVTPGPPPTAAPRVARPLGPRAAPVARELGERQRRHLDELITSYTARTAGSRRRAVENRDRRVHTRMRSARPETDALEYSIVGARADGARFWDIDGNEYVDLAMGVGVLLCGHFPPFVADAVAEQLALGLQLGPVVDLADEVADLTCATTGMERAFFGVTGTEAVRGALRVAQAVTGRSRFAMFSGSYHGQDDRVLAVADPTGRTHDSFPMAPGISPGSAADALVLPYGAPGSLEVIEANRKELGAILVEPVQSRNPALQPMEFLHDLRRLATEIDLPLVFDEVITGFRVHPRGAQGWFDVEADIASYGKCVGGGFPVSVVAGKSRYLDAVDGGAWSDGGGGWLDRETTYIGSTFEMHPAAMAATRAMLRHLEAAGPALQDDLNARTAALVDRLHEAFDRAGCPIRVLRFGSVFRFTWKGNASYAFQPLEMELFHFHLVDRGIYLWEGRTCFLSTSHTDDDLDAVVAAVADTIEAMNADGLWAAASARESRQARAASGVGDDVGAPSIGATAEQRALLEIERRSAPDASPWVVADHLALRGDLRFDTLGTALQSLVSRHEALRTVFDEDYAASVLEVVAVEPSHTDRSGLAESEWPAAVAEWCDAEIGRPFSPATGPLLRCSVLTVGDDVHHLLIIAHHLVCDGLSMAVMLDELAALYTAARRAEVADLDAPQPFRDVAARLEGQAASTEAGEIERFWRQRFPDGFPAANLPLDRPRPARPSFVGDRVTTSVEPALTADVKQVGADHRCTLFMTLLAVHTLLVHELADADDVVVATPVAGRPTRESATVVGYCSHLVPVRSLLSADTSLADHLAATRAEVIAAQEHAALPFTRIRTVVEPGSVSHELPVRSIFNLDRSIPVPRLDGLSGSLQPVPSRFALVDFRIDVLQLDSELRLDVDFRPDVLDRSTVAGWSERFCAILAELAHDPGLLVHDLISGITSAAGTR